MSASDDLAILLNECIDQRRRFEYDLACSKEDVRELRELNAELLEWLKHARLFVARPTVSSKEIDGVIAKAEAGK